MKLSAITDPVFEVESPDGTVKKLDPWKLSEQLEKPLAKDADGNITETIYDRTRSVFGFPSESEAAKTDPPAFTLSRQMCHEVQVGLAEFISGLDVTKKTLALQRK